MSSSNEEYSMERIKDERSDQYVAVDERNDEEINIASRDSGYLTSWRLGTVIACLFFGDFLIALDTSIINVALPTITSQFHSLDDAAWYGTAYLVTITAFQPIYGSLYKFFRTDKVYRISILIFEVGSIICAAAPNSNAFIVGRAIAGLGAAGILQGALSIISQVVALEKRPLYMGIVISVFVVTVCIGPPLGGVMSQNVTWRWCFWINLPIGGVVVVALTIFLRVRDQDSETRYLSLKEKLRKMDLLGCFLFVGGVCCLLLALQWGGQTLPWKSATVLGLLIGCFAILTVFAILQWKAGDAALIPLRVLGQRSILNGALTLMFLGASTYVNTFFLPFYFEASRSIDPIHTGVNFIPLMLSQMVALIVVGGLVKKWGQYVAWMLAGEFICIIGTALLTKLSMDTPTVYWASSLVVSGIGMGMAMQLPYTAVQVTLSDEDIPVGNAIAVLFYQLGGAIAISIAQNITLNTITNEISSRVPGLSVGLVIATGAANITSLPVTDAIIHTIREIWTLAVVRVMIFSTVLVAASVPFTMFMEWLNANKKAIAAGGHEEIDKDSQR